jgi:hypothetical protein
LREATGEQGRGAAFTADSPILYQKNQPEQLLKPGALLMQHMARSIIDSDYVCLRPFADIPLPSN